MAATAYLFLKKLRLFFFAVFFLHNFPAKNIHKHCLKFPQLDWRVDSQGREKRFSRDNEETNLAQNKALEMSTSPARSTTDISEEGCLPHGDKEDLATQFARKS